jgi:Ca-activated chloride channel homolog
MMFLWHHALWLLLLLPVLVGAYLRLLRRRNAEALRYPGLLSMRAAAGRSEPFAPHVLAVVSLLGLSALLLAVARPVIVVTSPAAQGTVVLLMDVSLSMAASDVLPTRLAAAKAAAMAFAKAQPRDVRIGVVAFGAHADVVQAPTSKRADVISALDRLELQRYTAIGSGVLGALLTLVPTAGIAQEYDIFGAGRAPGRTGEPLANAMQHPAGKLREPVAPGSYLSAAIILVSDGRSTMGIPAAQAAKAAANLGIRVFTVGVGTLYGGVANIEGWPTIHAEFDEETLKLIADITHAEYFLARDADKLTRIYERLGKRVVLEREEYEITAGLTVIGLILTLAAAGLSFFRFHQEA